MTIRQFWEKCKVNWPVKIICFVLAVFVYFFYETSTLASRTIVVPLGVSSDGTMLPASYHPPQVRVSLRGNVADMARIQDSDVTATLNIDFYTQAGKYDVPVQVNLSSSVLEIEPLEVNVSPAVVALEIAPRVYEQVPVEVDLQGAAAEGYHVTDVKASPSTLQVTGAASLVDAVSVLTTNSVNIDGRTKSFSQEVPVRSDNRLISMDGGRTVTVSVSIEAIQVRRSFENQTVYLYGLNPLFIAQFEPASVSFVLAGSHAGLEDYMPELHTVRADCSSITEPGEYELPVSITVPSGSTLVSQSIRSVKVTVSSVVTDGVLTEELESLDIDVSSSETES